MANRILDRVFTGTADANIRFDNLRALLKRDGSSRQKALANVESVIEEWIATALEFGRSIPEPKSRLLFA